MTDRKKPGVAFWATVVLVVVLVGYPLSFGPACWIKRRTDVCETYFYSIYRPLVNAYWHSPDAFKGVARRYVEFWLPPKYIFVGHPTIWFIH